MFSFIKRKPPAPVSGPGISPAEPPFAKVAVFICDKCGRKVADTLPSKENLSQSFQKRLKKESVDLFGHRDVRVMISSCQNVCPEGKLTAVIIPVDAAGPAEFLTIEPGALDQARETLLQKLRVRLGR